ncbi:hypothetical protein FNV43_RR08131 [Rhamnella rubrinervis]|uniref:Uncharacterized protein n=1 Tax=Rhamnella rubrinervis TaxID=2594499 RepID=A0A8K0HGM2_9ROSA|nr:hypothetical protein FNV43_RR08131 [Rhamnella rubrinervis]
MLGKVPEMPCGVCLYVRLSNEVSQVDSDKEIDSSLILVRAQVVKSLPLSPYTCCSSKNFQGGVRVSALALMLVPSLTSFTVLKAYSKKP